jgi:8-hydroxy-5-deazaflavin:NADPH oxidoreductase
MRVGVLGTGVVGQAIGRGFTALGHEVKLGGREATNEKAKAWAEKAGSKATVGTFRDAAIFGELIVLATLGEANESALRAAGLENLRGKVLIDATNPLDFSTGTPRLSIGHTDSAGERVQRLVPDAKVVKAFNTVGNTLMFRPELPGGPPDMFIAGNDDGAKSTVAGLLKEFGFGTADLGGIESARYLEAMCMVWVACGIKSGGWNHAFKLLRK